MNPTTRRRNVDIAIAIVRAGLGPKNKNDATMRHRHQCDLCSMLEYNPVELTIACVQDASGNIRAKCKVWGLPSCSWTAGLPSAIVISQEAK
jgi:hypothetical protein